MRALISELTAYQCFSVPAAIWAAWERLELAGIALAWEVSVEVANRVGSHGVTTCPALQRQSVHVRAWQALHLL